MATLLAGQNSSGTTGDFAGSGSTCVWPFTAVATGTSALMWCQFKVSNPTLSDARLGIYADSAGAPSGAPLGVATATAGYTGTGLFSAPVSGVSIVSGTQYWLGFWATGEQIEIQGTSAAGGREDTGANFANPHSNDGAMAVIPTIWIENGAGGAPRVPSPSRVTPIRLAFYYHKLFGFRPVPVLFPSTPQFIDLGVAAETDAAQALTKFKNLTLGPAATTHAAQALTKFKSKTLGVATTLHTAQALAKFKSKTLGVAVTTHTAQALNVDKIVVLVPATETDAAQALSITHGGPHLMTLTPATESDVAQALLKRKLVTLTAASETDAARALTKFKAVALGIASEADAAQVLTHFKRLSLGIAAETDSAQALTKSKRVTLGAAQEFDVAVPLSLAGHEVTIVYKYRGPVVIGRF